VYTIHTLNYPSQILLYTQDQNYTVIMLFQYYIHTALISQGRRNIPDAPIFGAELKNGPRLCVNYLRRGDLYEKRIIFENLKAQKCFQINKFIPVRFIFLIFKTE
jgi:hypothetical protein